jgi:predicted RND superfamily exporter protein
VSQAGPSLRDRAEIVLERWGHLVCRFRWAAIAGMALLTVALASGIGGVTFETSTENYLDPEDSERANYDAFRRQFANDDTILLLLHSEKIFSFEFLERLKSLHEAVERELPLVDEVTSLVNARVTRGSRDEIIVEELLEDWPRSEADLGAIATFVRSNPVYRNILISEDGRFTAIMVTVTPSGGVPEDEGLDGFEEEAGALSRDEESVPILEGEELIWINEKLREVVERHATDAFPIYVTGNPEMSYSLLVSSRRDISRFAGLSILLITVLLSLVFRRVSGVVIPLLVVTLPLTATLGIMGFAGLPITPSTQQLPTFLLVVGVADSVHLLAIIYRRLDGGSDKEGAIAYSLAHSGLAVVMTSLTTAGGLGSLMFADLVPVQGLGIAAPTGVLLALVYSLVLLPALVAVLPIRARRSVGAEPDWGALDRILAALGDFCTSRPGLVVACWSVVVAAATVGAVQLPLSHEPLRWFPEDHPTRVAAELANREMKGLMPLEIVIDSGRENGLHEPEVMNRIDRIQRFARSVDVNDMRPGQAISLVDILKETHQALNENDPAYYVIPQERQLIAQELLLFENSGSDDLEELVDSRFRKARISLLVTYENGLLYLPLVREVEAGAREIAGQLIELETTGLIKLWLRTISAMLSTTAKSYAVALLVIAPLMVLLIGEVRLGLLSLIPNLASIVMGMGLMQALGIPFDMFTLMIGTIAIGIAVDDTIHFMHGFRRYYRRGAPAPAAVHATLLYTGRALLITTIVLSSGFFLQTLGTMISVRNVGLITGFTLVAALLAALTLAPALVMLVTRSEERRLGVQRRSWGATASGGSATHPTRVLPSDEANRP